MLLRAGVRNRRLIRYKLTAGIALLLLKSTMTVNAQDMEHFHRGTCYYTLGKRGSPWGRQSNIGIAAEYKNGLNQFDLKAGHFFRPVYAGFDFKYRTSRVDQPGFFPGVYVRYSPYSFSIPRHGQRFGILVEANYHFSDKVFKRSDEPIAQDIGIMIGLCTMFGVGSPLCIGIEISAENEFTFSNFTAIDHYFYPVLRLNYYFMIYGKKDY
jgi:hypothetical protein